MVSINNFICVSLNCQLFKLIPGFLPVFLLCVHYLKLSFQGFYLSVSTSSKVSRNRYKKNCLRVTRAISVYTLRNLLGGQGDIGIPGVFVPNININLGIHICGRENSYFFWAATALVNIRPHERKDIWLDHPAKGCNHCAVTGHCVYHVFLLATIN